MISLIQIQKKIAEAIKQSGLTQQQISQALGINQTQISCYVHGKKMPALDTLANLCAILDLDANEILCLNDYNNRAVHISNSFNNVSNSNIKVGKWYEKEDLNVPNTASKQIKRITSAIDSLEEMPLRNPLYDKEPWHSLGLRKMLVDNYIVFYFPNETNNEIVIMHIFYSGRNILDILK